MATWILERRNEVSRSRRALVRCHLSSSAQSRAAATCAVAEVSPLSSCLKKDGKHSEPTPDDTLKELIAEAGLSWTDCSSPQEPLRARCGDAGRSRHRGRRHRRAGRIAVALVFHRWCPRRSMRHPLRIRDGARRGDWGQIGQMKAQDGTAWANTWEPLARCSVACDCLDSATVASGGLWAEEAWPWGRCFACDLGVGVLASVLALCM